MLRRVPMEGSRKYSTDDRIRLGIVFKKALFNASKIAPLIPKELGRGHPHFVVEKNLEKCEDLGIELTIIAFATSEPMRLSFNVPLII